MNGSSDFAAPDRGLWRCLYDFWARPIRAESLALFRIVIGTVILLSLLTSLGPRLPRDFGPDGLYPRQTAEDRLQRDGAFSLLCGPINLPLLDDYLPGDAVAAWQNWCDQPKNALLLFAVLTAATACMTVGCWTRTATIVAWALFVSFNQRLSSLMNGGDSLMRCALFYLLFAPSGAVWSIDWLLGKRRPNVTGPILIPAWPVRLMQIQIAIMYFFTGLSKLGGDWLDGEAVYWVLNDYTLTRWPYYWLPVPLFVCRLLSWATVLFEIGFPFYVAVGRPRRFVLEVRGTFPAEGFRSAFTLPALRPWALLAGLAFHLGILIHTEVGWFSSAAAAWYVLFLSGDGVRNFVRLQWLRKTASGGG
ncbi:MAG TPA: HTTM domain-containing protein, partial [Gemmataceae bacterium]|nr:HTTM domain-containing protein [Gemmataceae bacterium]